MAKLASPYRHTGTYGMLNSELTTLKIAAAETIDITYTFHVGNNSPGEKNDGKSFNADQYFLLSQNLGSGMQKKLVEYAPIVGKVYDFFEEEFGISSLAFKSDGTPSSPVVIPPEPTLASIGALYESPIHFGIPRTYMLRLPGPLAGMTAQGGGLNLPLLEWWEEVARREAFSYLTMEFAYYQITKDRQDLESQILPKVDEPAVQNFWLSGFGHQTHSFQNLIRVLWEEDR